MHFFRLVLCGWKINRVTERDENYTHTHTHTHRYIKVVLIKYSRISMLFFKGITLKILRAYISMYHCFLCHIHKLIQTKWYFNYYDSHTYLKIQWGVVNLWNVEGKIS